MNALVTTFHDIAGPALGTVSMLAVFGSVSLLVLGALFWLMGGATETQRRLRAISDPGSAAAREPHPEGGFMVSWLEPVTKLILPKEEWRRSRMRSELTRAGFRSAKALQIMVGVRIALAIVLPLLLVGLATTTRNAAFIARVPGIVALGITAVAGFYLPSIYLAQRIRRRQRQLMEAFPDAMDMLVVCVEAGLGLDSAIQRVGQELIHSHPELAIEFSLLSLELRAGKSRDEALRALAARTGLEEVQALTALLIQAEHFGTSIATALREHSDEMRLRRIQRAREKAAKLPVKLLFPVLFLIFPALFLIILGPAVVRIYQGFMSQFGGG